LYAAGLESNSTLRKDIAHSAGEGLPIYAECAGLMYLCRSIRTAQGTYQMCGVIDADVTIGKKPVGHGYVMSEVTRDNPFFTKGAMIYGHEFHYSKLTYEKDPEFAVRMRRGFGVNGINDGVVVDNVFASYAHIHAWGVPEWAPAFVRAAVARHIETSKVKV
jgi:cobyrinic acid a,c-diamide synthase